ncbi:MAG: cell division protein ZapA [candidate division Zixibacteria bacterium]|nr:cell division protein ZapA [candidate division Zixibacteria bacterium]
MDVMETKKQSAKVNIFGEDYTIKGEANSEYIHQVAQYLDRKMRKVSEGLANRSHDKVAVLAALNIADELFREREQSENFVSSIEGRLDQFCDILDNSIDTEAST